jgi:nucleoredoxin
VRGIPSLIILDADTGAVVNANGTSVILEDEDGKNFPWKPVPVSTLLQNAELVDREGRVVKAGDALDGKVIP